MLVARQFNFHYKNTLWIYSIWQLQSLKIWKETEDYIYTEHASIRTTEIIHQIDSKFTCSVKILNFICYVKNQSIVEQIDNSIRCWSRSLFQIKVRGVNEHFTGSREGKHFKRMMVLFFSRHDNCWLLTPTAYPNHLAISVHNIHDRARLILFQCYLPQSTSIRIPAIPYMSGMFRPLDDFIFMSYWTGLFTSCLVIVVILCYT